MPLSKLNVFIHQNMSKSQPCTDIVKISTSRGARIKSLRTFCTKSLDIHTLGYKIITLKIVNYMDKIFIMFFFPNDLNLSIQYITIEYVNCTFIHWQKEHRDLEIMINECIPKINNICVFPAINS